MEGKILEKFKELTDIDWNEIRGWRSPKKIVEYFKEAYEQWIVFCITLEQSSASEYKQKVEELDVESHPDYVAMRKRLDDLELKYSESERQRKAAQQERDELRKELRSMKKAGRPALDPMIVDRIAELRKQGLSIRKIAAALQTEGHWVHPATVGKYVDKIKRQTDL